MRIVIDLQACQVAPTVQMWNILDILRLVIQQGRAAGHQMLAVLNVQLGERQEFLCQQLASELNPADIRRYDVTHQGPSGFIERSADALREYFLQQLQADVVYVPFINSNGVANLKASFSIGKIGPAAPTVLHLLDKVVPSKALTPHVTPDSADWYFKHQPVLQQAAKVITNSNVAKEKLAVLLPQLPVVNVGNSLRPVDAQAMAQLAPAAESRCIVLLPGQMQRLVAQEVMSCLAAMEDGKSWRIQVLAPAHDLAQERLQQQAKSLKLPSEILEFVTLEDKEVADFIALWQSSRVLICYSEEHSNFMLQAIACHVPILCDASLGFAEDLLPAARYAEINDLRTQLQALLSDRALHAQQVAQQHPLAFAKTMQQLAEEVLQNLLSVVAPTPAPRALPLLRKRPRLAYISPLPPQKSGIADYSVELIPELARYFEIELVIKQSELDLRWLQHRFPLRSVEWFDEHADEFDHILYHFGNSGFHHHMFSLAEKHPGIIVLHDFYLGNVLDYIHHTDVGSHAFPRALYQAHGFSAFADQQKIGLHDTIWKYPGNKYLLDDADGVIVHSAYPVTLAKRWYGQEYANDWQVLPLLRGRPAQLSADLRQERSNARKKLGWKDDDFVLCSFGMLGPTKNNMQALLGWLGSSMAQDQHCHLVFVGFNEKGVYGAALEKVIANANARARIKITGFVSHEDYANWLLAADCAVQLRCNSRGETSAAVLDCLLYGLPTVINAHGSSAELPDEVVVKVSENCSDEELSAAFDRIWQEPQARTELSARALRYIDTEHAPEKVGLQYQRALQHFAQYGKRRPYQQLLKYLAEVAPGDDAVTEDNWIALANTLANNEQVSAPRQLFVDISALVQTDLKTGIQRVVRAILQALLEAPPAGYRIEPVFTLGNGKQYCYARKFMENLFGGNPLGLQDDVILARQGDIFLGLDLFMHGTAQNRELLLTMRKRGVEIHFIVYDILPVLRPDVFPPSSSPDFARWLDTIGEVSDGLLCISRAVADEVHTWLQNHPPVRQQPLQLGYFHLGADLEASAPTRGLPPDAPQIMQALKKRPSFLMVGTIEPRKGYAQTLAAFDLLWQQGVDVNLVIVGKQGWLVEAIATRLKEHLEKGRRLFWLSGVSDEMLLHLYQGSSALIASSEGEGFGLPLIEAAQHGLPLLLRNLPVFEEVAGEHAFYFAGLEGKDLAQAVQAWLALHEAGTAPQSKEMPWLTWQQSAEQFKAAIFEHKWYRQYLPEQGKNG